MHNTYAFVIGLLCGLSLGVTFVTLMWARQIDRRIEALKRRRS